LARVSKKVAVLDNGPIGGGASSAAAGLLPPHFGETEDNALVELCCRSAELYESWVAELRQEGAGDVGFRRPGFLDVWTDPAQAEKQRAWHGNHPQARHTVELLSAEELRRREPALAAPLPGAAYYPDYALVDPPLLMQGVARVAELAGVNLRPFQTIQQLVRQGERITGVHTDRSQYQPGTLILCAGAWSGEIAARLGLSVPTRPVKGQMLTADCRLSPVRVPLHAGPAVFVPRSDGRLTLGVTVEETGFNNQVTLDGLRTILDHTTALVPAVGEMPLLRAWAGLRPATPDGWPFMGPLLPLRNCWVSTGHFRKGILLAPLCARLVARSIVEHQVDEALLPFQPNRKLPA
jgi:glycine oxidase